MKIRLWAVSLAALGILAFGTPEKLQGQQRQRVTADVAPPLSASRVVKDDDEPGVPKGETYADKVAPDAAPGRFPGKTPAGSGLPIASSPASIDSKPAEDTGVKFKFKPGDNNLLQMESNSGLFKFYAGGRLQVDAVWLTTKDNVQAPRDKGGIGNVKDAVNFRRARFDFGGTFYKNIEFLMEWDFINTVNAERTGAPLAINTPAPTDLWVTFKDLPIIGNFRVGNQKPPVSFEHLTSSRFLNFMERSLAFDAFIENQDNGFEPGVMAFDTAMDQRMYWALGVFKNTRNIFGWNTGDGEYDVTGRLTCLPVWENDGETLVHVGLSASHRALDDHQERLRARLLVRNGPAVLHNIVAEARMIGSGRDQVAPEFVAVVGPWTFQAEYYANWVHDATTPVDGAKKTNFGTAYFAGGYAEVLYFLTGEHQTYNRNAAAFTRVTPRNNFRGFGGSTASDECADCSGGSGGAGIGAWQIGARYSFVDLDNKGIRGSTAQDLTLGLNWFLNPYVKVQWDYTMLYRNAFDPKNDGFVHGFGTRLAIDF